MDLAHQMTSSELCLHGQQLADSQLMKIVLVVKIVICSGCFITIPIVLKRRGVRWSVHHNTRLLFSLHIVFTCIVNLFFLIVHVYDIIRLSRHYPDPCDYVLTFAFVFNVRIIAVLGVFGQIYTMTSIALERFYATMRPGVYERTRSYKIGIGLCIFTFVAVFGCTYGLLAPGVDWSRYVVAFTVRSVDNEDRYQIMIWSEVVPEVVTIIVFHGVLFLNFRLANSGNHANLSNKYQIQENKKVIISLLPIFYIHFVLFFITSFGLSLFYVFFPKGDTITHSIFLDAVSIIPFYGSVMPIVLDVTLTKHYEVSKVKTVRGNEMDIYFGNLQSAWGRLPLENPSQIPPRKMSKGRTPSFSKRSQV